MAGLQNSSVLCFRNSCWIAFVSEMCSQQKGEVVGIAVELKKVFSTEQKLNLRSEHHQ